MVSLFLLPTVNVQANTVTINDQAGVLDAGRVQAETADLPVPILIFTTNTFTGDLDALNTYTRDQSNNQGQNAIAIGIDTVHRNISIEAGTNVQLSNGDASDAVSAFQNNYDNEGDYTSATMAAIDYVQNALSGGGMNPFQGIGGLLLGIGVVLFVIVIILGIIYDNLDSRNARRGKFIQRNAPNESLLSDFDPVFHRSNYGSEGDGSDLGGIHHGGFFGGEHGGGGGGGGAGGHF